MEGPENGPSPGCQRILRLSSSLLGCVDRHPHPGACRSGSMDAAAVTACLRRRAARLRRPARLVLVGDSRARILQQQLSAFLQLGNGSEPVDVRAEDVPEGPLRRHQLSTTRDLCRKFDKFCSHLVGNDLLQVDFWRRPYLHTLFTGKLRSLVAECRAGADGCPDLVVLNGGMWYLRAFDAIRDVINTPMTGAMMMRDHVGALRELLTELVSHTTVVWRLEEAVITDAVPLDRKDTVQRKLTMSHALFFDLQRQRILRLSSSLLGCVDRHPHPGACRSGSMDAAAVTGCLRRRAARLRRPARLVLVGDSRARILQQQLSAFLQLGNGSEPVDVRAQDVPEGPLRRHQLSTTRDLCRKFDKFCSHLVGNDLLQVDFWRRPYLHTLFTGKLWSLVAECRAAADGCPDLVVLNGGMWYFRAFDAIRDVINTPMTGAMMMRDHVGALREVLTELVSHTTVVWRLEEAVITDALPLDRKDTVQRKLTMSHALFFDLQRQRVCRPVKQIANSTDIVVEEIFDECDDEIHVGPEMRQRFVSKLLDILCETDGDRELGHCCRG
ncbi:hypothetical protein FJT64_022174 [Amphibalanus amphitrite]|uniref:Uncharacterized protein n=1 Tax=Amphibalanus amphitrite TaxID=1232801 RepID=A0A6A4WLW0_AMPAM|nr:hypothetical protein FJT64_022174 [Amphibalanus amphitrite]